MNDNLHVVVKLASGSLKDLQFMSLPLEFTALDLKMLIRESHPNHPESNEQRLISAGKVIQDHQLLRDLILSTSNGDANALLVCHLVLRANKPYEPVDAIENKHIIKKGTETTNISLSSNLRDQRLGLREFDATDHQPWSLEEGGRRLSSSHSYPIDHAEFDHLETSHSSKEGHLTSSNLASISPPRYHDASHRDVTQQTETTHSSSLATLSLSTTSPHIAVSSSSSPSYSSIPSSTTTLATFSSFARPPQLRRRIIIYLESFLCWLFRRRFLLLIPAALTMAHANLPWSWVFALSFTVLLSYWQQLEAIFNTYISPIGLIHCLDWREHSGIRGEVLGLVVPFLLSMLPFWQAANYAPLRTRTSTADNQPNDTTSQQEPPQMPSPTTTSPQTPPLQPH